MKRYQIVKKINANSKKMAALKAQNIELNRQHLLLSDRNQQYKEELETLGRGNNKVDALIGRVYWKEGFKDLDTGEVIYINRSKPVRKNGEWLNGF
jgi:hypothetical protein